MVLHSSPGTKPAGGKTQQPGVLGSADALKLSSQGRSMPGEPILLGPCLHLGRLELARVAGCGHSNHPNLR